VKVDFVKFAANEQAYKVLLGAGCLVVFLLCPFIWWGSHWCAAYGYVHNLTYNFVYTVIAIVGVIGLFIFLLGVKKLRRVGRFKRYVLSISEDRVTSVSLLAEMTRQPVDRVREDLEIMIAKGCLTGVWFNETKDELILGGRPSQASRSVAAEVPMRATVTCKECGNPKAVLVDGVVQCEFH